MAVIGTFGSFTAARLGIYASQASLSATGNNIANINTTGYTRQRMDLVSLYSYGNARYANSYQQNIGYGVLTDSVSQLRDPFLDIRYREENASAGAYEEKLDCLQQLSNILDEVGKGHDDFGVIEAQFNDFLSMLENLNGKVGSVEYDTTVRGSAQTLAQLFNDYSKAMNTLAGNKLNELKENVKSVNALLTQIRDLNVQIRDAGIVGDQALELRDARNLCIDQLSAYMKIDVSYDMEKIDEWNSVERINISIADSGTPPIKLIQGIYGAQLSMPEKAAARNPNYDSSLPPEQNYKYISKNSNWEAGIIKYTNDPKQALTDANGKLVRNVNILNEDGSRTETGTEVLKMLITSGYAGDKSNLLEALEKKGNFFVPEKAHYLILDDDGNVVDYAQDEKEATQVNNALEGADDNRLWMTVEPLVDAKGRYMRDEYHKEVKTSVDLSDTQLYGSLQSIREFLTEKGEFSGDIDLVFDSTAAQKRGLPYYQKALDALARKFADAFNRANQLNFSDVGEAYEGEEVEDPSVVPPTTPPTMMKVFGSAADPIMKVTVDVDGKVIVTNEPLTSKYFDDLAKDVDELAALREKAAKGQAVDSERMKELEENIELGYRNLEVLREQGQLTDKWSFYNGGVLFSTSGDSNDASGINAGNITISKDWSAGDVRILNTKKADGLDHSTADDNILHMIALMSEDMNYFPNEITDGAMGGGTKRYFTGSFQERLADMSSILSVETQTTSMLYNEYTATTLSLENSRQSVSGVDLNDEATNMMVFQKSYAAACQLMTTLDSMLDKLINGTLR